eukprot:TRINITY_DN1749_c0_g1_i3.p1 TRINITY_DN1749_c0_g1~~TRINITY_DN1749_c0_g1_i3.p1  ORF type:complete len:722 (+),score=193.61 TRINITY_DN1749_c0_g1_i3:157-2322(+)
MGAGDDDDDDADEVSEELQRLRHMFLSRIHRLEAQVQDMTEMNQEEAEGMRELAMKVSLFKEDFVALRGEVRRAAKRGGDGDDRRERRGEERRRREKDPERERNRGGGGGGRRGGGGGRSGLPPGCDELEARAIRAELELRAVQAEMELRAVRADLELRALRAERELALAREEDGKRGGAGGCPSAPQNSVGQEPWGTSQSTLNGGYSTVLGGYGGGGGGGGRANDGGGGSPQKPPEPMMILGRYEVHPMDLLGQGGFSVVRRGLDLDSQKHVAVKSYTEMEQIDPNHPQYQEAREYYLAKFRHEVQIFRKLHEAVDIKKVIHEETRRAKTAKNKRMSWYVPTELGDERSPLHVAFENFPTPYQLFPQLLDYSKERVKRYSYDSSSSDSDCEERPGPHTDGICYTVLELADYTLADFLYSREQIGLPLGLMEVERIFLQLAQIIAALHARNFVHADLKPLNIMHFPDGRWKLIDMDGMVEPGVTDAENVCYTPLYCPPEMARQCLLRKDTLDISRHLDVWSLGMTVCELVTLRPVLEPKLQEMNDMSLFMEWLADPEAVVTVPEQVWRADNLLAELCQRMLVKDTNRRISMVEALVHPFFTGSDGLDAVLEKGQRHEAEQGSRFCRQLVYASASMKLQREQLQARKDECRHDNGLRDVTLPAQRPPLQRKLTPIPSQGPTRGNGERLSGFGGLTILKKPVNILPSIEECSTEAGCSPLSQL